MPTDSPSPEAFKISDKDGAGEGAGGEAIKMAASRHYLNRQTRQQILSLPS